MPVAKPFSLSGMVDTDIEEDPSDADPLGSPDSNQENIMAGKRGGKTKASGKRFTKPKRQSDGSNAPKQPKAKGKRAAPKQGAPVPRADFDEEADEFAQSDSQLVPAQDGEVKRGKRKAPEKLAGRPPKVAKHAVPQTRDGEFECTPGTQRPQAQNRGRPKAALSAPSYPNAEVQESQATAAPGSSVGAGNLGEEDAGGKPDSFVRTGGLARAMSKQRQADVARRRAGSVSDVERTLGDAALRRRLGDMTRKYESLDLKYKNLKEVGVKEAEVNYEKLKKQSEANAKAANDLISFLKKEIASQTAVTEETRSLQQQASCREADLSKTRALADQLSKSLADAQNENKVLQARLANTRSASSAPERTPGSAMKGRFAAQSRPTAAVGNDTSSAANIALLKEELYTDLTGLIVRSVDIGPDADNFDCIQTGRNGTLHFKLAVSRDTDESYENTEIQYTPRLDTSRDRDLMELLPEYLTEEITFARVHAAMFYGRVQETLTKRPTEDT